MKPWSEKFANAVLKEMRDLGYEIAPDADEDEIIAACWEEHMRQVQAAIARLVEANRVAVVGFVEGEDGRPKPLYRAL